MTNTPTDLAEQLELAAKAARAAGKALAARAPDWNVIRSEIGKDIKLSADVKAEEIILEMLSARSAVPILSEEKGWSGDEQDLCWVVDPLDGTANYTQNIPMCCVSIALMQGWQPVLGVIYDFNHDELYTGGTGIEAKLNGTTMKVGGQQSPDTSVLATGFPAKRDFSDEAMGAFARDAARWRKVRMLGSAAMSLAYVACGRADAYQEESIMIWDVAAGCALVEAAGGSIMISGDDRANPVSVSAANQTLIKSVGSA